MITTMSRTFDTFEETLALLTESQKKEIQDACGNNGSFVDELIRMFQLYQEEHIETYTWTEWWPWNMIYSAIEDWTASGLSWTDWVNTLNNH
jgi:hypothetical protein